MNDLKSILERCNVQRVEYVYSDEIQENLDKIDKDIKGVAELYSQKIAAVSHDEGQVAALKVMYDNAVAPLVAAKTGILVAAVPKVILHLEEKPTLN